MTSTLDISKLAELREKTDRDLVRIIGTELERGLILASVATNRQSPLYLKADKVHRRVATLLSKVYSPSAAERASMEARLLELRAALDQVPQQNVLRLTAIR
jgi:hypothetical protein